MADDRHIAEAQELASRNAWGAAAVAFAAAGGRAARDGDAATAREAWHSAGACWRRDDRPDDAARALARALALDPDARSPTTRVELAACHAAAGRFAQAIEGCEHTLGLDLAPGERAIALDTLVGLQMDVGDAASARATTERLGAIDAPLVHLSADLRRAGLARAEGDLDEAEHLYVACARQLESAGAPASALAGVHVELAELAELRGRPEVAVDLLHDATDAFGRDGRVALAWSTEAARLRAQLAAGALPLAPQLGRGCAFAEERGLLPLLAELELTRGQLALAGGRKLAARDALLRAAELAARCGQRWHAGRASAAAAAAHPDAAGLAESAVELLSGHKPWRARARLVLARRLAERGEASAPREACGALARLEAIGMHADARNAATLARELGGPCT